MAAPQAQPESQIGMLVGGTVVAMLAIVVLVKLYEYASTSLMFVVKVFVANAIIGALQEPVRALWTQFGLPSLPSYVVTTLFKAAMK